MVITKRTSKIYFKCTFVFLWHTDALTVPIFSLEVAVVDYFAFRVNRPLTVPNPATFFPFSVNRPLTVPFLLR